MEVLQPKIAQIIPELLLERLDFQQMKKGERNGLLIVQKKIVRLAFNHKYEV